MIVAAFAMPGVARADDDVRVSIAGVPQVGSTLVASATAEDGGSVVGTYAWRRCTGAPKKSCVAIAGATGPQYTPTEEDIKRRLRVRLTLSGDGDDKQVVDSGPTAWVSPAPAPAPAPPESCFRCVGKRNSSAGRCTDSRQNFWQALLDALGLSAECRRRRPPPPDHFVRSRACC